MTKELPESQVTQDQFDIWLSQPVTVAFLKCLEWRRLDIRDALGEGQLLDSSSADLTHAMTNRALGEQDAYRAAYVPWDLLTHYDMIMLTQKDEDE